MGACEYATDRTFAAVAHPSRAARAGGVLSGLSRGLFKLPFLRNRT